MNPWIDLPLCSGPWDVDLNTGKATCGSPSHLVFWAAFCGFLLALFLVFWYLRRKQKVLAFHIRQLPTPIWSAFMAIKGIAPGAQGTFAETPLPSGTTLPAGVIPQWSANDTGVTLTPSADGTSCVAAVATGDANPNFVLTVSATLPDGTQPNGKVTVPILQPEVTGFSIDQTA
jgi:hypothetical protein